MKSIHDKPEFPGELVYLGVYTGKHSKFCDTKYDYDLWFGVVRDSRVVISKSKYFYSFSSFYAEQYASEHDGLKEAIDRAYNRGLDLL